MKEAIAHPSLDLLRAFDAGKLTPQEYEAIERHVAGCNVCCQSLESVDEDALVSLIRSSVVSLRGAGVETCAHADTPNGADGAARRDDDIPAELRDHPRYRLLDRIGAGGMGVVFRAEHRLMERIVALKVLNRTLTSKASAVDRFRQEVKAAARLAHPNIVVAYDADQAGEVHFLVTEFVEGAALDRWLAQHEKATLFQACDWIRQTALGLQHAFERGMIHRDIKPSNLLLTPQGRIKILDFGLARFVSESHAPSLTPSAMLVGTPDFVAPEQARDPRKADIRADIYSLGGTLYQLLTGQLPFPDGTILQKLIAHQETEPLLVSELRQEIPPDLAAVVARMLAKDPAQRFQTPLEVAAALAPFVHQAAAGQTPVFASTSTLAEAPAKPFSFMRPVMLLGGALGGLLLAICLLAGIALVLHYNRRQPEPIAQNKNAPEPPPAEKKADPRQKFLDNHPMLAWVKQNHTRDKSDFIDNVARQLLAKKQDEGILCIIGADLLKSKRRTTLALLHNNFFVFEIPDDPQHPTNRLGNVFLGISEKDERPLAEPWLQLSPPKIEHADQIVRGEPITGTIDLTRLRPVLGDCTLRLRYTSGNRSYTQFMTLKKRINTDLGTVRFAYPTDILVNNKHQGPLILFFLMTSPRHDASGEPVPVVSNVAAAVVNVAAP